MLGAVVVACFARVKRVSLLTLRLANGAMVLVAGRRDIFGHLMNNVRQIVIDTNILVAAFRSRRGVANLLLTKLNDVCWQVNLSTPLLLKYEDVLKRPEMRQFIAEADLDTFLNGLCSIAQEHEIFYLWSLCAMR